MQVGTWARSRPQKRALVRGRARAQAAVTVAALVAASGATLVTAEAAHAASTVTLAPATPLVTPGAGNGGRISVDATGRYLVRNVVVPNGGGVAVLRNDLDNGTSVYASQADSRPGFPWPASVPEAASAVVAGGRYVLFNAGSGGLDDQTRSISTVFEKVVTALGILTPLRSDPTIASVCDQLRLLARTWAVDAVDAAALRGAGPATVAAWLQRVAAADALPVGAAATAVTSYEAVWSEAVAVR